jgi:hypothetical protein
MSKARAPKDTRLALANVISHLESLADTRPDDDPAKLATYRLTFGRDEPRGLGVSRPGTIPTHACGVTRDHRQAVAPFLDAWVIGPLRAIAEHLAGSDSYATTAWIRDIAAEVTAEVTAERARTAEGS